MLGSCHYSPVRVGVIVHISRSSRLALTYLDGRSLNLNLFTKERKSNRYTAYSKFRVASKKSNQTPEPLRPSAPVSNMNKLRNPKPKSTNSLAILNAKFLLEPEEGLAKPKTLDPQPYTPKR